MPQLVDDIGLFKPKLVDDIGLFQDVPNKEPVMDQPRIKLKDDIGLFDKKIKLTDDIGLFEKPTVDTSDIDPLPEANISPYGIKEIVDMMPDNFTDIDYMNPPLKYRKIIKERCY